MKLVKPCVYIFMNKSLDMSSGKLAAQSAHAMAEIHFNKEWYQSPTRTVMIMQARNQEHIYNIQAYLEKRDIKSFTVVDEGVNETESHVVTALATQVVDKDSDFIKDLFSTFELYRDKVRFKVEIDV